ncbi:eukaryotic translation initiation factor 2-alpha kinase [Polistes fuscatus]|uniref:eukaryotic translation initiation factor 2-alpha kinase n=1 Tax=Polistes fuscatus TaxID=30207 RepID=UPI001CA85107|nr:eukaryotic translation initiation factor 2-alpha kinase [Polistes fuscatus]
MNNKIYVSKKITSCTVNKYIFKRNMSKIYFMKEMYFYAIIVILYNFTLVNCAKIDHLTICEPYQNSQSLIFISTLDGKVSALDVTNNGKKLWSLEFNESPMLSSNIHRRELNNNGQWVRLIPSLGGGLYKFDGENLEKLPVKAEQLLSSSFRYSDDMVFSGGKETRSYGVLSKTGQIIYECNINGCYNITTDSYIDQEILVIQHLQNTVRAVEPHSGQEKWNFSVGQHELLLIPNQNVCNNNNAQIPEFEIKVIVPEGLVWAIKKDAPNIKLWQYKFDSPIVTIWQEEERKSVNYNKRLKKVNLFDNSQWTWGSDFQIAPSIYIGMHDRQLYVQENEQVHKSLGQSSTTFTQHSQIPWKPYPASDTALITNPLSKKENDDKNISFEIASVRSATALSVMYNSDYINGNGFYLYSKEYLQLNKYNQCSYNSNANLLFTKNEDIRNFYEKSDDEYDDDETPVQVIIVSLWYWWKEVLVISITTALLLNFIWTQHLLNGAATAKDAIAPPLIIERHIESKSSTETTDQGQNVNFKSRYLTDFEPIDCLGKGGYGVVFEAKNKIDDCNYAIKRIALPNSQGSRERVMREVKALAKLDHCNIVRYFNAWFECPPIDWLEEHDKQWISKKKFLSSEFSIETSQSEQKCNNSIHMEVSIPEQSSVDSACEAYALNHVDDNDDSFIVFENSEKKENEENVIDIDVSTTESSDSQSCKTEDDLSDDNDSQYVLSLKNNPLRIKKEYTKRRKTLPSINSKEKSINRKSTKMFLYIQMQLYQRFSLREWLKKQTSPRDNNIILNIFHQIVDAVEYVHLQGLIHRDLKPSNIFFAYDDKIKIGDFGLVTAMTEGYKETCISSDRSENTDVKHNLHTSCVGTQLYMSPEQMNGQVYNYKVDIYSLGIIFFELLTSFSTEMERVMTLTNLRRLSFPKDFEMHYPAEHKLLNIMLDEKPEKRPTAIGIKAKPPLSHYRKENGFGINEDSKWHFELP